MAGTKDPSRAAEFSRRLSISDVGQKTLRVDIEASEKERRALAVRLGLVELKDFRASLAVQPWNGIGFRASGTFMALVRQRCSISLEPFDEEIGDEFNIPFVPEDQMPRYQDDSADLDDDEPAEPIEDGQIDLGELLAQLLALAIKPYPRKPGANLEAMRSDSAARDISLADNSTPSAAPPKPSPFSALEKLKNRLD